jgi:MFS transporter, DHA1 family, inner membrane transport protein
VLGLIGMFLFLVAVGEVWPMVGPIAQSHGVGAAAVGSALAIAGLAGIGAGLLVSLIGSRFGRLMPLIVGTLGLACAMLTLLVASDGRSLVLSTSLIMFFWIFSIPYYLGSQSALDPSGRLAVLSSAMMPFIDDPEFRRDVWSGARDDIARHTSQGCFLCTAKRKRLVCRGGYLRER